MDKLFEDYLFQKQILVRRDGEEEQHVFETLYALANLFNVSIGKNKAFAQNWMIAYVSERLGEDVPQPFYVGFPESVRALSPDERLFDQMVHYATTYGLGDFSNPGHSLLEEQFERTAFKEKTEVKVFEIMKEAEAVKLLAQLVDSLLASSRPLSIQQFEVVSAFLKIYAYPISRCGSKNTAVRLMVSLNDLRFTKFLALSDVMKLLDEICYAHYNNENLRKINLKNQDRKFLTKVLDEIFAGSRMDLENCYEKKALWCGLLHHLHYQPKCDDAREFLAAMRGKENASAYSAFEAAMAGGNVMGAARILKEKKGTGAVLRNLNYLVSRMENPKDLPALLEELDTKNNVMLMQLLVNYRAEARKETQLPRTIQFTRHCILRVHAETPEEELRRKSQISRETAETIAKFAEEKLRMNLKNKLGKVYVDPAMGKMALPLQETTAQGGLGVLAKGSRLPLPEGKKIRAFTYWEKVNDIDLSVIGIDRDQNQYEFSWRTMAGKTSDAILYSGDETSGYHGGSEFFDVDLEKVREWYPALRHLIFCNNVFTGSNFDKCYCTAGYMMRDQEDSGEIFEPKTVQSSFRVNCPSTFAYLFGIDLVTNEFVWLNVSRSGTVTVAGTTNLSFLEKYFRLTESLSIRSFFEMMATELVEDPAEADVIVSNRAEDAKKGRGAEVIHAYDFERLLELMNA